ncbi:tetratricopeptide repeat protein [Psychromonas sp. PT13]|uniref:tetratricopeptide repeat protein n=1 Tax=Psychromonas sp. PT13 TaxID=3439547 RepID=UPI003EB853AB
MKQTTLNIQVKKALTTLLLSSAIVLTGCGEAETKVETINIEPYIQQAQSYLQTSQFKPAISAATDAIKADPTQIEGYIALAKVNEKLGRPQQNIDLLEAYKGTPNSEYYFTLLNAYQKSGKLVSSQQLIDDNLALLQKQPQRFEYAKAQQLLFKKELTPAKKAFEALLDSADYKVDSMLALAKIAATNDDMDDAMSMLDNILAIDDQNTEALFLKSAIYLNQNDLENTEKLLTQALSSLPTTDIFTTQRIQIIQSLSNVLTQQGRSAEAMIYSRILAEEFPAAEPITIQYNRAVELFENQQFSAAKEVLLEILDNAPQYKKASTLLGLIYYKEGDPQNAEKYLADIVDPEVSPLKLTELYIATQLQQNKPDNVLPLLKYIPEENRNADTWVLYGNAALQEKNFTDAKMALDKAYALDPTSIKVILLENFYYNSLPEPQPEIALQALSKALSADPDNAMIQNLYLRQLLRLGQKEQADNYVETLRKGENNANETQLIIANYYIYQQKTDAAKQIIETLLSSDSNNLQALYTLTKIENLNKDWAASLSTYKKIIALSPEDINAYKGLMISLVQLKRDPLTPNEYLPKNYQASVLALTLASFTLQQNKLDLAAQYIETAENELPSKYQGALAELTLQIELKKAIRAYSQTDYPESRKILMAAIQTAPEDTRLLSLLVHIEIASGQYDEAQKITEQIQTILPDSSLSTLLTAEAFVAKGERQQAITVLDTYWTTNKDDKVAEQLYIQLLRSNVEQASTFLEQWVKDLPNSLTALRYQAIELQSEEKIEDALKNYEKILAKNPNDVITLNNAAWLYSQDKNPRALTLAKRAYQLAPNNGAIADTYGWILFNNGDKAQGKILIEQAIKLIPNEPSIKEHFDIVNKS